MSRRTVEHAAHRTRSQAASVMASAPRVWVRSVNRNREEMGLEPIQVRGVSNTEGSASQLAENKHMLLQEKIRLLLDEVAELGRG